MKQHDYAVGRGDVKGSALAEHKINSRHTDFSTDAPQIIEKENNKKIRKIKEAYYIRKKQAGLNRREELGRFNPVIYNLNSWPTIQERST